MQNANETPPKILWRKQQITERIKFQLLRLG